MPTADATRSKQEQKSGQRQDAVQPASPSAELQQSELMFIQRWVASAAASSGGAGAPVAPGPPGGAASPTERHIDGLQRFAGNAAVAVALQRDPEPATAADEPSHAAADQVQAVLDQIAPIITRARETPDAEVIASTTAPDSATGMLEQAVSRLWRHRRIPFLGAVRRAAANDPRGAHFVQSGPAGGDERYGQRWSLNFLAANYRNLPDLPEIRALLRRGSPYRESQEAEFSRVIPLEDPTGAQMRDALVSTVTDLSLSLRPGEIGQLLVTYSGHGRGGILCGDFAGDVADAVDTLHHGDAAVGEGAAVVAQIHSVLAPEPAEQGA